MCEDMMRVVNDSFGVMGLRYLATQFKKFDHKWSKCSGIGEHEIAHGNQHLCHILQITK